MYTPYTPTRTHAHRPHTPLNLVHHFFWLLRSQGNFLRRPRRGRCPQPAGGQPLTQRGGRGSGWRSVPTAHTRGRPARDAPHALAGPAPLLDLGARSVHRCTAPGRPARPRETSVWRARWSLCCFTGRGPRVWELAPLPQHTGLDPPPSADLLAPPACRAPCVELRATASPRTPVPFRGPCPWPCRSLQSALYAT